MPESDFNALSDFNFLAAYTGNHDAEKDKRYRENAMQNSSIRLDSKTLDWMGNHGTSADICHRTVLWVSFLDDMPILYSEARFSLR